MKGGRGGGGQKTKKKSSIPVHVTTENLLLDPLGSVEEIMQLFLPMEYFFFFFLNDSAHGFIRKLTVKLTGTSV